MSKKSKQAQHHDDPKVIRVHQLFAWPVVIASIATVVGLFLSLAQEPFEQVGEELVMAASLVIVAESLMVMLASGDKRHWLRRHGKMAALSVVTLALFVLGVAVPVHLLRLVGSFSASPLGSVLQHAKVLHVGEFGHAKEHLSHSSKLAEQWHKPVEVLIQLCVPLYLVLSLRDPESDSRQLLRRAEDVFIGAHWRLTAAVVALVVVVVVAQRQMKRKQVNGASAEAEPST
jgi:hypothetical protein